MAIVNGYNSSFYGFCLLANGQKKVPHNVICDCSPYIYEYLSIGWASGVWRSLDIGGLWTQNTGDHDVDGEIGTVAWLNTEHTGTWYIPNTDPSVPMTLVSQTRQLIHWAPPVQAWATTAASFQCQSWVGCQQANISLVPSCHLAFKLNTNSQLLS